MILNPNSSLGVLIVIRKGVNEKRTFEEPQNFLGKRIEDYLKFQ
jgi:hypothetical protein